MRRIVTSLIGIGLLLGILIVVADLIQSGWFHRKLPPQTLATTASEAEDVASAVAFNAGCGNFNNEEPTVADNEWLFMCNIGRVPFGIYIYGSDEARTAGLAQLRADGRPFLTKFHYAVTVLRSGTTKDEALTATPPPDSILDPFR